VILDGERHARYCNPVLHHMLKVHDAKAIRDGRPSAAIGRVPLPMVARSTTRIMASDGWPGSLPAMRLRPVSSCGTMWNGAVLRRQLAKLPNGNRMLIYSDATAQAEATAERPCCAGAYRRLTGVSHSVSIGVPPPSLRMTVNARR